MLRCVPSLRAAVYVGPLIAVLCGEPLLAQNSAVPPFSQLAALACETGVRLEGPVTLETGYIATLGVNEKSFALRVIADGSHAVMVPATQCGGAAARSPVMIFSHVFTNALRVREGYYYLAGPDGELLNAVHFRDGRSQLFALIELDTPVRRADFEAEKEVWLTRLRAAASVRKAKSGR